MSLSIRNFFDAAALFAFGGLVLIPTAALSDTQIVEVPRRQSPPAITSEERPNSPVHKGHQARVNDEKVAVSSSIKQIKENHRSFQERIDEVK